MGLCEGVIGSCVVGEKVLVVLGGEKVGVILLLGEEVVCYRKLHCVLQNRVWAGYYSIGWGRKWGTVWGNFAHRGLDVSPRALRFKHTLGPPGHAAPAAWRDKLDFVLSVFSKYLSFSLFLSPTWSLICFSILSLSILMPPGEQIALSPRLPLTLSLSHKASVASFLSCSLSFSLKCRFFSLVFPLWQFNMKLLANSTVCESHRHGAGNNVCTRHCGREVGEREGERKIEEGSWRSCRPNKKRDRRENDQKMIK